MTSVPESVEGRADMFAQLQTVAANHDPKSMVGGAAAWAVDKIEGLETDLQLAVEVAFSRGATEWTRLNYPKEYARLTALAQGPKEEGVQTAVAAGPGSGREDAPASGTNIPDWLFRLDHVFEAVVRDLRTGLREAAHEIMRLDTLVANPPLAPDRRDVLRLIEKHYHETDAMADALMGLFRSRPESVAQRDGAARVQITPPQRNGLNPDLSSPLAKEAEGWKLVPVEPSGTMVQAACDATFNKLLCHEEAHLIGYRAMLAAVPTPQGEGRGE